MNNNYYLQKLKRIILCQSFIQIFCVVIMFSTVIAQTAFPKKQMVFEEINASLNAMSDTLSEIEESANKDKKWDEYADMLNCSIKTFPDSIENPDFAIAIEGVTSNGRMITSNLKNVTNETPITEQNALIYEPIKKTETQIEYARKLTQEISQDNVNYQKRVSAIITIASAILLAISLGTSFYTTIVMAKTGEELGRRQMSAEKAAIINRDRAYTDNLTGLWNRKYLESNVEHYIRDGEQGYLFMIDMDHFKSVNDIYGHIAGDNVLKIFARVMEKISRDCDICCRAGGDEFMLFAKNMPAGRVDSFLRLLNRTLRENLMGIDGGDKITLSIGAAQITSDIHSFKSLYDKADSALYHVKENGRNGYCVWEKKEKEYF